MKEVAKFLSGLVTGDLLVLLWLSIEGQLPMDFLGVTVTARLALLGIVFDIALLVALLYYAWGRD